MVSFIDLIFDSELSIWQEQPMASGAKPYGMHMTWVLSPSSKLVHSAYKITVPCGNPNEKLPFAFVVPVTVFFFMVKRDTECYSFAHVPFLRVYATVPNS